MPKETPEVEENSEGTVEEKEDLSEKELEDLFNKDEPDEEKVDEKPKKTAKKSSKKADKKVDEKPEPKEEDEKLEEPDESDDKEPDDKDDKGEDEDEAEEEDKGEKSAKDVALEAAEGLKVVQDKETEETEKVEAEKKADEEAEANSTQAILKDADLSPQAREFVSEFEELSEVIDVVVNAKTERIYTEFNNVLEGLTGQYNETIANLVGDMTLTKNVPGWEDLIFSNKTDKDGKRIEKEEWKSWIKEQPEIFKLLYTSKNPMDNVKLLKYYQKDIINQKVRDVDKKKKDKLKKEIDKHGHTPAGGKSPKKKAASGTWEEEWDNEDTEPEDD